MSSTNNSTCSLERTSSSLIAYTDGSCPNNRTVGPDNPAGWGFALCISSSYTGTHPPVTDSWTCSSGQVKNSPLDENVINPVDGSNNTGEMRAIIELFDYLRYYSDLPHGSTVVTHIDSTYVIRSLRGDQLPSTHHQLVELAQQYYTALRAIYHAELVKVPSHVGVPGNELADSLAKRGVTSFGRIGPFSSRVPLNPPLLGYNSNIWLSKTPQEQPDFLCSLLLSKKHSLPTLPVSAKKPWISASTLDLITRFQDCTDLTIPEIKSLRKHIKKSATRDKQQFIAHHLQEDFHGSSINQWRTARSIRSRKPFTPRSVNLFNIHGKLTSKDLRATTFAEYLSEKVWKAPDPQPIIPENPSPSLDCSAPFTMAELNLVLRSLSTGRAPGPDSIPSDMIKGSPYILKLFLLDHFTHCFSTSTVPDSWALSEVVMLVKKIQHDTRDLSNYRPISLTNSMCKIFASLIQKRFSHFFDDKICSTQHGFRAKRSTNQPIHIMRRILEIYERQQNSLHVLFLDWSKAFDSVSFSAIESSLRFFGVPLFSLTQFCLCVAPLSFGSATLVKFPKLTLKPVVSAKVVLFLHIYSTLSSLIFFTMLKLRIPPNMASCLGSLIHHPHFGTSSMLMTLLSCQILPNKSQGSCTYSSSKPMSVALLSSLISSPISAYTMKQGFSSLRLSPPLVAARAVTVTPLLCSRPRSPMRLSISGSILTPSPIVEKMFPIGFLRLCPHPSSFARYWPIEPFLHPGNSLFIDPSSSLFCSMLWKVHNSPHLRLLNSTMFISNPYDVISVVNLHFTIGFSTQPVKNALTPIWRLFHLILLKLLPLLKFIRKIVSLFLDTYFDTLLLLSSPLHLCLRASIAIPEAPTGSDAHVCIGRSQQCLKPPIESPSWHLIMLLPTQI